MLDPTTVRQPSPQHSERCSRGRGSFGRTRLRHGIDAAHATSPVGKGRNHLLVSGAEMGITVMIPDMTIGQLMNEAAARWGEIWDPHATLMTPLLLCPRKERKMMELHGDMIDHGQPVLVPPTPRQFTCSRSKGSISCSLLHVRQHRHRRHGPVDATTGEQRGSEIPSNWPLPRSRLACIPALLRPSKPSVSPIPSLPPFSSTSCPSPPNRCPASFVSLPAEPPQKWHGSKRKSWAWAASTCTTGARTRGNTRSSPAIRTCEHPLLKRHLSPSLNHRWTTATPKTRRGC